MFIADGKLGYATPSMDPNAAWSFNAISGDTKWDGPYIHGSAWATSTATALQN